MRRAARITGTVLIVAGVLALAWVLVVWRWQDPFTALYTTWQQHRLAAQLDDEIAGYRAPALPRRNLAAERRQLAAEAARFRRDARVGAAIGRIAIPGIGLRMVLVNGTDDRTLTRGPGRDLRSFMPGESRLVYIAGHRTTYLAPFSHIDNIRPGDEIRLEMPYGTFIYRAYRHRIVPAGDLSVLRSPDYELLELQACHPRFFATHRYIVYARLVWVQPRGGVPFHLAAPHPDGRG